MIPLHLRLEQACPELQKLVIERVFAGGTKSGANCKVFRTAELAQCEVYSSTSAQAAGRYHPKPKRNFLTVEVVAQDSWERDVQKRGLTYIGIAQTVTLFAVKLHSTHYETYEAAVLMRGAAYTAKVVRGFIFRHGALVEFHGDRKRGAKSFRKLMARDVVKALNGEATETHVNTPAHLNHLGGPIQVT